MKGYIVDLFKATPYPKEMTKEIFDYHKRYRDTEWSGIITWSKFDRLEVTEIDNFRDLRMSSDASKSWIGERQFVLLYQIGDNDKQNFVYKEEKCIFNFRDRRNPKSLHRFCGISMLSLSTDIFNDIYSDNNPSTKIKAIITKYADKIIRDLNVDLCYDVFGVLGANDAVIIWLSNQFTDILKVLSSIRRLSYVSTIENKQEIKLDVFSNSYTILGCVNINQNDDFSNLEGEVLLGFTQKKGDCSNYFKNLEQELNLTDIEMNRKRMIGESDIQYIIPSNKWNKSIYQESGLIHYRTGDYYESIIQSNTCLFCDIEENQLFEYTLERKELHTELQEMKDAETNNFNMCHDLIRKICENELIAKTAYIQDTFWLLLEDYTRNATSMFSYPWLEDLNHQFLKTMEFVEKLVNKHADNIKPFELFSIIHDLASYIHQTTLHISQSNRLFFESPNSHLKHTGSYSKILRAYYGITKIFLKLAYSIPKDKMQPEIIPYITFDITPKITSNLYIETHVQFDTLILGIRLPYAALTNIRRYTAMLAHEVFHYISPNFREKRNRILGHIIVMEHFSNMFLNYCLSLSYDTNKIMPPEWEKYCEIILDSLRYKIKSITKRIYVSSIETSKGIPDARWNSYYNMINEILSDDSETSFDLILKEFSKHWSITPFMDFFASDSFDNGIKDSLCCIYESLNNAIKNRKELIISRKHQIKTEVYGKLGADIQYALREATSDLFMIQTMNMNIRSYLEHLYDTVAELGAFFNNMQKIRLGIVLDVLLAEDYAEDGYLPTLTSLHEYIKKNDNNETNSLFNKSLNSVNSYKSILIKAYEDYIKICDLHRAEFNNMCIDLVFSSMMENNNEFEDVLNKTNEYIEIINNSDTFDFEKNTELIERLQYQETFKELSVYLKSRSFKDERRTFVLEDDECIVAGNSKYSYNHPVVTKPHELIRCLEIAISRLKGDSDDILWYRGHPNSNYKLLPSLLRVKEGDFYLNSMPRNVLKTLISQFRTDAYGVQELIVSADFSDIELVTSMQHYGLETNMLDWTDNAFTALYFALEDYIDSNKNSSSDNAALCIINPERLNYAREYLATCELQENDEKYKSIKNDLLDGDYPIPSISKNTKKYSHYLPGDVEDNENIDSIKFPLAIKVSYSNSRIKSQTGYFTAFNLDYNGIEDIKTNCRKFCDISIENMQKEYFEKCKEDIDMKPLPFYQIIEIDLESLNSLGAWLRDIGAKKKYIYPELSNTGRDISKQVKSFYNKADKKC